MENIENVPSGAEPEKSTPKVSPFENSPYVMPELDEITRTAPVTPKTEDVPALEDLPPVESLPENSTGRKLWKRILAITAVAALVITAAGVTALASNRYWSGENAQLSGIIAKLQQQIADLEEKVESNSFTGNGNSISGTGTADGLTPGQVYAQNYKGVVAISNQSTTTNIFGQVTKTASSGSGFIISEDGYIITNYHVVKGAVKLTVILSDSSEYAATLIGYNDDNDFALLKIEATDLPFLKLGNSDDLIIGDQVVAIGNPLGELTNTLTVGYVSAKERDVTTSGSIINMLQTDAAINPGNSGGPLFNMKGEVIGITTAKYSGTTSSGASIEGISFAIPIQDVKSMAEELVKNGFISAPYIGVNINQRAEGMGVYIESITPGTPAETIGLKAGDIIVGIGEYTIKSISDLDKTLRHFDAHETTTIFIYRNRQVLELRITFAEKNQTTAQS